MAAAITSATHHTNAKSLANKVEAAVAAQNDMVTVAAKTSLASAPPASNLKVNLSIPEVVTTKAFSMDDLAIESAANLQLTKHSLTSSTNKKVEELQGQLTNLHKIVCKTGCESGKLKSSIEEMETKLIGKMNNVYNNLAALIKANVSKPVKHESKTGPEGSPLDISIRFKT